MPRPMPRDAPVTRAVFAAMKCQRIRVPPGSPAKIHPVTFHGSAAKCRQREPLRAHGVYRPIMRIIIGFILGIVVGAYSLRVYERRNAVPPIAANPAVSDTTREAATGMGQAVSEKLADWHLTPDEVKADLSRSGQVVREKAQVAGD